MKTDLEIARQATMKPILEVAGSLCVSEHDFEAYGRYKGKLSLDLIDEAKAAKSRLILVTAMTPTPAGEGKTTVSVGLAQGLCRLQKKTAVVLREPSLGPVFGIKGGGAGGGYSQVLPMEDINLHFTGDISAVEKAHNLLSAMIDNQLLDSSNPLRIDPRQVTWKRVMDMNDRALRNIVIGLGGKSQGTPRETRFNITAASEVMAILCMARDIKSLKERLGNIWIGYTYDNEPVFAKDFKAEGAMTVLLKDAIMPNLVQTIEGTPAIIHGGPFANISQGTNSIIGTKMGLSLCDYVVTEAGFASDLGAEKFFNIKCRSGNLEPAAVVLVATVKALKYHGGVKVRNLDAPDPAAVEQGLDNLAKHVENVELFGLRPVVAINRYDADTPEELELVEQKCRDLGVTSVMADVWQRGGEGALDLAAEVVRAVEEYPRDFKFLYELDTTLESKIETVATQVYGADHVEYSIEAKRELQRIESIGFGQLPICIAKTQKSLSDDPRKQGRPRDFTVKIREVSLSAGAGFVVPIAGTIMRMPGLPTAPSAQGIDIDDEGNVTGLS
jgi:formate--tetrahydrofolate ligase